MSEKLTVEEIELVSSQTKRQSAIETITSVAIGYLVAIGSQIVIFPIFGLAVSFGDNLLIGAFFTVVSIIRGYLIRRMFNRLQSKKTELLN